jgi:hypothetical protein
VFTLGLNKFRVQSKCCHKNQVFLYKIHLYSIGVIMKKTQLKTLATKIHGLAVKSANGKKAVQNKALEKIAVLLNQAIEAEIKQAHTGIASQVRGLAEKLEPTSVRRAVGRKKVTRRKPVATKRKPPVRRGRVKPTEGVAEQTETTARIPG